MSYISRFVNSSWEGLKISLTASSINKTRFHLTTLCIIMGIAMVMLMNAVSNGMALWIETEPVIPIRAVLSGFFGMSITEYILLIKLPA